MSIIKLDKIVKKYGSGETEVAALQGLSLTIEEGEMLAIIGASGSGKSTLLNIIGCLDKPTDGLYELNNRPIMSFNSKEMAEIRNRVFGFIVQDFALVDRYNVYQNVMIPLAYSKKHVGSKSKRIEKVLSRLGIKEKKKTLASRLSGGQRQRVAIARAIVNEPDIILADEPTGSLDSNTGKDVLDIFKDLNNAGKTIIIVTHNMDVASACNHIVEIRDGKIV